MKSLRRHYESKKFIQSEYKLLKEIHDKLSDDLIEIEEKINKSTSSEDEL